MILFQSKEQSVFYRASHKQGHSAEYGTCYCDDGSYNPFPVYGIAQVRIGGKINFSIFRYADIFKFMPLVP